MIKRIIHVTQWGRLKPRRSPLADAHIEFRSNIPRANRRHQGLLYHSAKKYSSHPYQRLLQSSLDNVRCLRFAQNSGKQYFSSNGADIPGSLAMVNHKDRVNVTSLGDGIVKVELSRPAKMNSLDMPMFEAIAQTAATLRDDRKVRACILCGEGRAFSTGLDVKAVLSNGNPSKTLSRLLERPSGYERKSSESTTNTLAGVGNLVQDVGYLWRGLPFPVIAAIHGMCFGGGLQIALGADMRFATPDCKLSVMEAKWGLIPDMSGSLSLRELLRIDVAKELTMTGRVISGTEAAKLGLVTRAVDDPFTEAHNVAKEIVKRSPDAVAGAKRLFQETWVANETYCLEVETDLQMQLVGTWNQAAASAQNFGWKLPYIKKKELEIPPPPEDL